jgi:hypothetical protein
MLAFYSFHWYNLFILICLNCICAKEIQAAQSAAPLCIVPAINYKKIVNSCGRPIGAENHEGGVTMPKEKEKDLCTDADAKLSDAELEQAAGGQVELVQDEPVNAVGACPMPKDTLRGDHMA